MSQNLSRTWIAFLCSRHTPQTPLWKRISLPLIFLLLLCGNAVALAAAFRLEANQNQITEGEVFQLILTFTDLDDDFQLPDLDPHLQVLGESSRSSFSMINGRTSSEKQKIYSIRADQQGSYVIGPFTLEEDGRTYTTEKMTLEVEPPQVSQGRLGSGAQPGLSPDPGTQEPPFAIHVSLAQNDAYQGQWLTLFIDIERYANGQQIQFRDLVIPQIPNLRIEEGDQPRTMERMENGRRIEVTRVLIRIQAQEVGNYTLQGFRVTGDLLVAVPSRQDRFFGSMFGNYVKKPIPLTAAPVALEVKALPEPIPADFSGIVGDTQWDIQFPLPKSKAEVATGESLTMSVNLISEGELAGITLPEPRAEKNPNALKVYADQPESSLKRQGSTFQQHKTWTYALVPTEPGEIKLQDLSLTTFSPTKGEYVTLRKTFPVFNAVGAAQMPTLSRIPEESGVDQTEALPKASQNLRKTGIDIMPIERDLREFADRQFSPLARFFLIGAPLGTLVLFLASLFSQQMRSWGSRIRVNQSRRGALTPALKELQSILERTETQQQLESAPQEMLDLCKRYLERKLQRPLRQKTASELLMLLGSQAKGAHQDSLHENWRILQELENQSYMASSSPPKGEQIRTWAQTLQRVLSQSDDQF